jgi:hypothetical protein
VLFIKVEKFYTSQTILNVLGRTILHGINYAEKMNVGTCLYIFSLILLMTVRGTKAAVSYVINSASCEGFCVSNFDRVLADFVCLANISAEVSTLASGINMTERVAKFKVRQLRPTKAQNGSGKDRMERAAVMRCLVAKLVRHMRFLLKNKGYKHDRHIRRGSQHGLCSVCETQLCLSLFLTNIFECLLSLCSKV